MRHVEAASANPMPTLSLPKLIRVLAIEDDFGDYDAIVRALSKMQHFEAPVTRAKTLETARKLMLEHAYDILLIDYNLGAECGARLIDEIGGRSSHAVPILLTGLLDREVHEVALLAGAIGCINKNDLSPTLLETTIRYAIYTHRLEFEVSVLLKALAAGEPGNALSMLALVKDRMPWLTGRSGVKAEKARPLAVV